MDGSNGRRRRRRSRKKPLLQQQHRLRPVVVVSSFEAVQLLVATSWIQRKAGAAIKDAAADLKYKTARQSQEVARLVGDSGRLAQLIIIVSSSRLTTFSAAAVAAAAAISILASS